MAAPADKNSSEWLNVECPICGKRFHLKPYLVKRAKVNYCSRKCHNIAKREYAKGAGNHQYGLKGELNASWKGGRRITRYGYVALRMHTHPFAQADDTVLEHRLVAEKYLLNDENSIEINGKRYLKPEYAVHHKNHNKQDNRPENLEVMLKGEHSSLHCLESPMPRDPKTHRFLPRNGTE